MKSNNLNRANRLTALLRRYGTSDCPKETLTDVLADARHWCDRNGESFAELDRIAYQHYIAELSEETGGLK